MAVVAVSGADVMNFYEVLEHVLVLLDRHGRVSYRALKRQFDLDDEALDDLKEELLYAHPVIDDEGRGLAWTGDTAAPEPDAQRGSDAESRFHALLPDVIARLKREKRVTYRTLKYVFAVDDTFLEDLRKELALRRLAIDEDSAVLVWMDEAEAAIPPVAALPASSSSQ